MINGPPDPKLGTKIATVYRVAKYGTVPVPHVITSRILV
jgi:hypothetical protein